MVAEELYILKHKDLDVAMVKINTFSGRNLLQGKHPEVFETAVKYYYQQACEIGKGIQIAREYGKRANCTVSVKEHL